MLEKLLAVFKAKAPGFDITHACLYRANFPLLGARLD
jgi:hypothetical protein